MSKNKNNGLDQYDAERFGIDSFCHNHKKCGMKAL